MERNIRGDKFARRVVFVVTLGAFFAIAALRFIPFSPVMPQSNLDASWALAMNQAVVAHLVFGRDVIFTFGPYSSVYTTYYHPSTDVMVMLASTMIVMSYCLSLFFILRTSTVWVLAAVALFLVSYLDREAFLITLPLAILFAANEIVWPQGDKLSPVERTLRAAGSPLWRCCH